MFAAAYDNAIGLGVGVLLFGLLVVVLIMPERF